MRSRPFLLPSQMLAPNSCHVSSMLVIAIFCRNDCQGKKAQYPQGRNARRQLPPSLASMVVTPLHLCLSYIRVLHNCLIVLKPYLMQIMNSSGLNFADLWLTHVHFHPSIWIKLVIWLPDTRLCNIEKLGIGLETRLETNSLYELFANWWRHLPSTSLFKTLFIS